MTKKHPNTAWDSEGYKRVNCDFFFYFLSYVRLPEFQKGDNSHCTPSDIYTLFSSSWNCLQELVMLTDHVADC